MNLQISSTNMLTVAAPVFISLFVNCATQLLFEGDRCTVPATQTIGKCVNIEQCEYAKRLLESHDDPQFCGFSGNMPLVCCPQQKPQQLIKPGSKSDKACSMYHSVQNQVFGIAIGQPAVPREFPHMAAVGYGDKPSVLWLCGGSLISKSFILTAAHCVFSRDFGPAKWVRLGDLDLKNTTEDADPLDLQIVEAIVHPDYKPPSHYHDVALFKVPPVDYFRIIYKPACLHTEKQLPRDTLQVTGWGKEELFGDSSSHLMKASLQIVEYGICARKFSNVSPRKLKDGILDELQICAGSALGSDTCPGDSGGPLHYKLNATGDLVRHFVVAGITSFGKGCGGENSVGVYTRVSSYVDWIENIVWQGEILE